MATYTEVDMKIDASGDLVLDGGLNFKMATSRETLQQDIMFRARTEADDFGPHPNVGADLQSLVGEPNNRENASRAEKNLYMSLTRDGRVSSRDLRVKAVPISMGSIAVYTFVSSATEDVNIYTAAVLNYENGVSNTQEDINVI